MFLELERAEEQLLIELVTARLHELEHGAESGAPQAPGCSEPRQMEILEHLLHRLHEAEFDVTC